MNRNTRFFTTILLAAVACHAVSQTLSVASVEATTGGQAELVVSANDMAGVTAIQFNLALPQGFTLNESAITDVSSIHTLSVQTMANGDRLIVLYQTDLGLIFNGTLMRLPITVGQQAGSFSGSLNTVRTANTEAESHACSAVGFSITVKAPVQPVTITADNKTMTYGDDVPTLTYKSSGATLSGTPKLSTTATKTSPVGTYPIKVEKGTVTNEQVTYVDGTLTIGKAPLTVGVQNVTITEGDAIPTFTLTYSGWRNNDKEATAFTTKPTATTTATSASKPGTYPITVSGGAAQNYALTYTLGTLTIKEKEKQPIAEGIYELTVEMFHLWDDCTATAKVAQQNGGGESHVGEAVGEGSLIYGVSSVYYLRYADLTDYDKLVIIGTPGIKLRVLMNRKEVGNGGGDENGGSLTEVKPVIGDDGLVVVPLTDNDFAHLNAIKTDWSTPSGTVKRLALVKGNPDMTPLGIDQLSDGLTAKPIIYNLGGQRLEKPRKGINIIGGKKVFVP